MKKKRLANAWCRSIFAPLLMLLFLMGQILTAHAQENTGTALQGSVSSKGKPVQGVSVSIKGTQQGVTHRC